MTTDPTRQEVLEWLRGLERRNRHRPGSGGRLNHHGMLAKAAADIIQFPYPADDTPDMAQHNICGGTAHDWNTQSVPVSCRKCGGYKYAN